MPVPKLKASSTPDVMKSEDGKDSLDTIIRQAIGKEPFLSFSRAGESPVQWIQLLHALDQQELPGWPLLSPLKVQLQKCDKCSREFCSPINYRRHIRVHHRLKKLDKDSTKNRDLLGAYWDKLSSEEAKEVVSFNNVMLEDVPGSSIIKSLTTLIRKLGFSSLPQYYLKAGSTLLEIVQARSRFPITSQELFSVLDDASEKTFLCGPAMSMQKYVFDGEAGKIGLEPKNLVACTSFLLEQNLIMAWLADKDAEALKCQKLLMEEEEAAQKRQAEILEKKRQKKLRQKEQKGKEQRHEANLEMKESISSALEVVLPEETSVGRCDFEVQNGETFADYIPYSLAPFQCPNTDEIVEDELQSGYGCGCTDSNTDQNIERQTAQVHNRRRITAVQRQVLPKQQWAVANGFHASHSSHIPKLGVIQKHGTHRDQKAAPIINGNKVWSIKSKPETDGVILKDRLQKETDPVKRHEILIGSISVTLGNCSQSEGNMVPSQEDCTEENLSKQNSDHKKLIKVDTIQSGNNRPTVKLWRPVSRQGSEDSPVRVQNVSREVDMDAIDGKGDDQNSLDHSCLRLCDVDNSDSGLGSSHSEDNLGPGSLRLSSHAAKAFLAQRWKEAISSDHVKLVLSTDSEPPGSHEILEFEQAACHSSNDEGHSILRCTENRLVNKDLESATSGAAKSRLRMKPEKGVKIKYIPKQKTATQ